MYELSARGQLGAPPFRWRWGRPGLGEGEDIPAFQAPPPQVFPPVPLTIDNLQRYLWDYGQAAATEQEKRQAFEALAQVSGMARAGADLATICAQAGKRWPLVAAACTSVPMVVAPIGGLPVPIPLAPAPPQPQPAPPPVAVTLPAPAPPPVPVVLSPRSAPFTPPPVAVAPPPAPVYVVPAQAQVPPTPLPFGYTTTPDAGGGIPTVAAVPTSELPPEALAPAAPPSGGLFGWIGRHPVWSLGLLLVLAGGLWYTYARTRRPTRGHKVGPPTGTVPVPLRHPIRRRLVARRV